MIWVFRRRLACRSFTAVPHDLHTAPNRILSKGDATLSRIESRSSFGSHAQSDSDDDIAMLVNILNKQISLHQY
jgi:hypothetical protein